MEKKQYIGKENRVKSLDRIVNTLIALNQATTLEKAYQILHKVMEAIGQYTQADRAYIFEVQERADIFTNTVEWCNEGVASQKDGLQRVHAGEIPYWYQEFLEGKSVVISDMENVRLTMPHEYVILHAQHVRSVIEFPFTFGTTLYGFVGVDNSDVSQLEEFTGLMRLVSGYLGAAKQNFIIHNKLENKKQEIKENKKELAEDRLLLEILCQDYTSVYLLNINTGAFRPLKLSVVANFYQMKRVRVDEEFDFISNMNAYADAFVTSDKAAFKKFFSLEEIRRNLQHQARVTFRYKTIPNAGGYQYFEGQVVRIREQDGQYKVMLAYHYIDDIIQQEKQNQKKLEQALVEAKLSNEILSALGKLYFSIFRINLMSDHYDEVTSDNEVHRLTGVAGKASEKLETLCETFVVPKHRQEVRRFFDLSTLPQRLGQDDTVSIEYLAQDGNWHQARFIVKRRNEKGEVTHVLFVIRLISELKRKEERLISLAEEATRANEAKTDFLSCMAHDIRTPMNAVRGFTAIAESHLQDQEKVAENLHKIEKASRYLQQIVNDILDLTSIEKGKFLLDERETDILSLMEEYKEDIPAAFADKHLHIECHIHSIPERKLIVDSLHLRQIYTNLLSNAIKYTPKGGHVMQEFYEEQIPNTNQVHLIYRISDTGIGMSKDYMKEMYNPFSRAVDTRVNQVRGSGLGLSVVKELVDLMKGHLKVESQLGKGTTFTVTIPVTYTKEEHERKEEQGEKSFEAVKGMHLLVAEDNELNYEVVKDLLDMYDISCERAENGSVCVEKFQSAPMGTYDAILMDMQMPVMNGLEATRSIRLLESGRAHKILIIGLTANAFTEDVRECLKAGMNYHMAKPFDVKQLLTLLEKG